jgi:hypothetical protein
MTSERVSQEENTRKCIDRVTESAQSTLEDLRILWDLYCSGDEDGDKDLGTFWEHGLSFDYVAPHTFNDQRRGYFRYQISWGGPSTEFRFYTNPDFSVYKIEFWLLDWFDGAYKTLYDADYDLMQEIWEWFRECSAESVYNEAMDA